jgi:sulfonate transport system substrate-binding protein
VGSPCKICLELLLTGSGQDQGTPYQIKWADFDSAPPMMEAMNAGRVDVSWAGEVGVFYGVANGARISLLAAGTGSGVGQSRVLVKNGSPIHSIADLKGKKVAMPYYTIPHYPFAKALEQAGLSWNDVHVVNLSTTDGLAAFNSGAVDAFVVWDPNAAVVQTSYDGRALLNLGEIVNSDSTYFASSAALADPAKKSAIEDLTRRVVRAFAWADTHQEQWAAQIARQAGVPAAGAQLAASRFDWQLTPITPDIGATWQGEIDYFAGLGQFKQRFTAADLVAPGFGSIVTQELGAPAPAK